MNNFQTILTAVFLAFFVFAVLIFSGVINLGKKGDTGPQGKIVIWGTYPNSVLSTAIDSLGFSNKNLSLSYINKNPETYQQDLIEAFANGTGPDLFIINPDMIQKNDNFIYKIPYASYKQKDFTDAFIDGANTYLGEDGIIGIPLVVDPIVLYYNKDILSNEGIVNPPKTWDELFTLNSILTKRDNSGTISRSMIALGQYNNINNAKDILATLLVQNNNPIAKRSGLIYESVLNDNSQNLSVSPVEAVLQFFLEFSNQSNTAYSWNRSLPNSKDMFTSGKLAFYIGRASELFSIESVNPNLSFDVAEIPQVKDSNIKRTYGDISAIAVSSKSTNISSAFLIAGGLTIGDNAKSISVNTSLPPTSRILLTDKPNDPYLFTFFNSALIARTWPDPDKVKSDSIFNEMVENILSNRLSIGEASGKAQGQLDQLMKK
jgi:ABC-type glycerol-3-phosphate transport system substrate-binding protein